MCENRRVLGSSANLSEMWRYTLLRQFAKPARQQTRAGHGTSGHRIGTARRALVVLLSGRHFCRILRRCGVLVYFRCACFDKFPNLRRGYRAGLARYFETVSEQRHRRDRSNMETVSEGRHFFRIHLCDE